jgi:hypothetical protein
VRVKPGRATTVAVMRSHFQTVPPARWRYVNSWIGCELCANGRRTSPEPEILTPLHCPTQTRPWKRVGAAVGSWGVDDRSEIREESVTSSR